MNAITEFKEQLQVGDEVIVCLADGHLNLLCDVPNDRINSIGVVQFKGHIAAQVTFYDNETYYVDYVNLRIKDKHKQFDPENFSVRILTEHMDTYKFLCSQYDIPYSMRWIGSQTIHSDYSFGVYKGEASTFSTRYNDKPSPFTPILTFGEFEKAVHKLPKPAKNSFDPHNFGISMVIPKQVASMQHMFDILGIPDKKRWMKFEGSTQVYPVLINGTFHTTGIGTVSHRLMARSIYTWEEFQQIFINHNNSDNEQKEDLSGEKTSNVRTNRGTAVALRCRGQQNAVGSRPKGNPTKYQGIGTKIRKAEISGKAGFYSHSRSDG